MVGSRTRFDDTCEIIGVKNEIAVTGEILQFREHDIIIATIHRSAKVTLHWQENVDQYVGSMGGVEFRSEGPNHILIELLDTDDDVSQTRTQI